MRSAGSYTAMRKGLVVCLLTGLLFVSLPAAELPNQLTAQETAGGWKLLFDGKTPEGWRSFKKLTFPSKGWVVEDGWLACLGQGGGDVISTGEYDQFDLEWDWKIAPAG